MKNLPAFNLFYRAYSCEHDKKIMIRIDDSLSTGWTTVDIFGEKYNISVKEWTTKVYTPAPYDIFEFKGGTSKTDDHIKMIVKSKSFILTYCVTNPKYDINPTSGDFEIISDIEPIYRKKIFGGKHADSDLITLIMKSTI